MGFLSDLLRTKPALTPQDKAVLARLPTFKADHSYRAIHDEEQRRAGTNEAFVPTYVSGYIAPEKLKAMEPSLSQWAHKWGIALSVDKQQGTIAMDGDSYNILKNQYNMSICVSVPSR